MQKAIECVDKDMLSTMLAHFKDKSKLMIHDQNGNHVIQKCVEVTCKLAVKNQEPRYLENIDFIVKTILDDLPGYSCHAYGCRVVQRMLEHCIGDHKVDTLNRIGEHIEMLIDDQFGNYVLQHTLQYGLPAQRELIISLVKRRGILVASSQKFASNVVEKILVFGTFSETSGIIGLILESKQVLIAMVKNPFANYVVQKAIAVAGGQQKQALLSALMESAEDLRSCQYFLHIQKKYLGCV